MGANANLLMAGTNALQGGAKLATAFSQAGALSTAGSYQQQVDEGNARISGLQSSMALQNGDVAAYNARKAAGRMIGTQRAGFAAQGVDVNSGSALKTQEETAGMGALDALTIKNNAWKQAWGYQVQGANYKAAGAMAGLAGKTGAGNTLLTGGLQALQYGIKGFGALVGPGPTLTGREPALMADPGDY